MKHICIPCNNDLGSNPSCGMHGRGSGWVATWKLWLDDDLNNPVAPERHVPAGYIGAATSAEAIALVKNFGAPSFMSLDFDLGMVDGKKDTAELFLKWLANEYPDSPPDYEIHSRNVAGAPWIESWMESWKKSLSL